jgi:adenylate cyclase
LAKKTYDIFINLKNFSGRSENVVIIGIDKDSFEKYSISSSGLIPRRVYADLINAAAEYRPAVLAFDVIFERRISSEDDRLLIESLTSYPGPIVMSSTFQGSTGFGAGENYVEPWKDIGNANLSHGYVNIFRGIRRDFDSIRRFYLPYTKVDGRIVHSLPLAVAEKIGKIEIDENQGEVAFISKVSSDAETRVKLTNGFGFINYYGDLENFSVIPLSEFMHPSQAQKEIYKKLIGGKVLLVGVVNPVYRDFQDIPAMSFSLFPKRKQEYGVVILANIIENLFSNQVLQSVSAGQEFTSFLFCNFAFASILSMLNPLAGLLVLSLSLFLLLFLAFYLFFAKGLLVNFFLLATSMFCIYVISAFNKYYQERRERQNLYSVLQKYVSPEVAKLISRSEYEKSAQGEKRVITVVFADIRGFTQMAEKMDPWAISHLLNEYFNRMTEIIFKNGGTIDKFIGDAIMILFGAPIAQPDAAIRALKTAEEMRKALKEMHQNLGDSERAFHIGIGINTGEVFVGNLGSDNHKEYTALGDAVNIAARLESLAKPGQILFSEQVLREAGDRVQFKRLDPVILKGKSQPLEIFELEAIN